MNARTETVLSPSKLELGLYSNLKVVQKPAIIVGEHIIDLKRKLDHHGVTITELSIMPNNSAISVSPMILRYASPT